MKLRGAVRSIIETVRACEHPMHVRMGADQRLFEILCELGAEVTTSVYVESRRAIDAATLGVGLGSVHVIAIGRDATAAELRGERAA